jgi:hypothetical protein
MKSLFKNYSKYMALFLFASIAAFAQTGTFTTAANSLLAEGTGIVVSVASLVFIVGGLWAAATGRIMGLAGVAAGIFFAVKASAIVGFINGL